MEKSRKFYAVIVRIAADDYFEATNIAMHLLHGKITKEGVVGEWPRPGDEWQETSEVMNIAYASENIN